MPSKDKFFVPSDWELTDKLRQYARKKGLSDAQIDDQEERFRDCQFQKERLCWDRTWRNWIRNGIDWGKIVVSKQPNYRRPEEVTDDQRAKDKRKHLEDMAKFTLKAVK